MRSRRRSRLLSPKSTKPRCSHRRRPLARSRRTRPRAGTSAHQSQPPTPTTTSLTYSLNGGPDAGVLRHRSRPPASCRPRRTSGLRETKASYSVTVSVSDSKDDEGNTDTTIGQYDRGDDQRHHHHYRHCHCHCHCHRRRHRHNLIGEQGRGRRRRRPRPLCPNSDTDAYTEPNTNAYTDTNGTAVLRPDNC